jgi:MFS family permease
MQSKTSQIFFSRSFLLTFFSFFFLWISFDFFILFPLFIMQKGGDSVDVGIQQAIFFFPTVFMRPFAGWLADRFGRLKILWFGSFLMILTALAFLLLHGNYQQMKYWIALILFLRGGAFASFYVGFFTYAVDLSLPENRARVIGLFGLSGLIAHGAAPKVGEIVLHAFDFKGFFLISAALSLISLLISAFLREQEREATPRVKGWHIVKELTFTRRNLLILPGAFSFGFVIASFNTFGAPYFELMRQGSVGSFFLIYGGAAALVRLGLGGLGDRYSRWKLVASFFALQAAGLAVVILHPVAIYSTIAASLTGAAHGILFPLLTAMAIDAHPQQFRGVVTSIFTANIELGFSIGSYLLGVVIAYTSYQTMFLSASFLGLLFALYAVFVGRHAPPLPVESPEPRIDNETLTGWPD